MAAENTRNGQFNLEEFSSNSLKYYDKIRLDLEAHSIGKYAALDFQGGQYWIGDTAAEALAKAKKESPDKLFFIVQIGSPAAFSIQSMAKGSQLSKKPRDLSWANR